MNFINLIKDKLSNPLFTFKLFERFIAAFCIFIPLILWMTDGAMPHPFLPSISKYVYMDHSYVFGMLLSIAAMLFIFNGAVYFKNEQYMHISKHGQWYNVVLGLSMIGVICFPCNDYKILHAVFAVIFFGGNAFVTFKFRKDKDKTISTILAFLTVASFLLCIINKNYLLVAEWISLTVISIHFILSTINMDQPVNLKKTKVLLPR